MNKETPYSILHTYLPFEQINYRSKEYIASVCREIIEDILKQTYDEENPISLAPLKCSKGSQTERVRCLTVQHNFVQKYILVSACKPHTKIVNSKLIVIKTTIMVVFDLVSFGWLANRCDIEDNKLDIPNKNQKHKIRMNHKSLEEKKNFCIATILSFFFLSFPILTNVFP